MRRFAALCIVFCCVLLACEAMLPKDNGEAVNTGQDETKTQQATDEESDEEKQARLAEAEAKKKQAEKEALAARNKAIADAIKHRLEAAKAVSEKRKTNKNVAIDLRYDETLWPFYEARQYQPILSHSGGLRAGVEMLEAEIDQVNRHALQVEVYRLERLHDAKKAALKGKADDIANYELLLIDTWLKFARDLSLSNINSLDDEARKALSSPPTTRQRIDVILARIAEHLKRVEEVFEATQSADDAKDRVEKLIAGIYPPHSQYKKLLNARERYLDLSKQYDGKLPKLKKRRLKRGRNNPMIVNLKKRLAAEGYYSGEIDDMYDDALDAALVSYAETHQYSLRKGVPLGMWKSLNVPFSERAKVIEENIRRWHRTMLVDSDYYIYINVPDFHGELWKDGKLKHRFRVVVGNRKRACDPETKRRFYVNATPRQREKMLYLEYNPYWNVPRRIEQEEYLPKMHEDTTWLETHGYEYYTDGNYTVLRQLPGDNNALGRVKFIFPNKHSTFLHDSPKKRLFDYPMRAFSHGCMRVQDPLQLAQMLLEDDGQWKASLAKEIEVKNAQGRLSPKRIIFKRKFDVITDYYTVRVDPEGHVHFLADPYRYVHDALNPPSKYALRCKPEVKEVLARPNPDGSFDTPATDGEDVTVDVDELLDDAQNSIDAAAAAQPKEPSAVAIPTPKNAQPINEREKSQ